MRHREMVRIAGLALLAALVASAGGCSSLLAVVGPRTDLTVLRPGASRAEIEGELGRPRSVRLLESGVAVTYRVRVTERNSPVDNAATVVGTAARAVSTATPTRLGTFLGVVTAVPAVVLTDLVLSTREVSRLARGRSELTVYYDDDGRVVRFIGPARR